MSTVQTKREVTIEDVQRALSNELGPNYRVAVDSNSTLMIGRTGIIPAKVTSLYVREPCGSAAMVPAAVAGRVASSR
jgi:hypothetical protein